MSSTRCSFRSRRETHGQAHLHIFFAIILGMKKVQVASVGYAKRFNGIS